MIACAWFLDVPVTLRLARMGGYQFEGFNWQLSYDGAKPIFRPTISRSAAVFVHKYEEMLASGTMFNSISLYNILTQVESDDLKFEAKGTKKVKNRNAYIVEVRRSKAPALRMYFDQETFMWVRTEYGSVSYAKNIGTFTNDVVQHGEDQTNVDFA